MANEISIKIQNSGNFYVSDDEFIALDNVFHYGFLLDAPVITLSATDGGFINFSSASIKLTNEPFNTDHPFGSSRYLALIENSSTTYQVEIKTIDLSYAWIKGTISLENLDKETLSFTVYPVEYNISSLSSVTDLDSNVCAKPLIFGAANYFDSLIQTSGTAFSNPVGLTSGLTLYEDGASKSISSTSSIITCASYSGGQAALSSSTAKTLKDFFDYCCVQFGLDVSEADVQKSTTANSLPIKIIQTDPIALIQLASQVAHAYNHQFLIKVDPDNSDKTTLYLIDRANNPASSISIDEDELINTSHALGYQLSSVTSEISINTFKNSKLTKLKEKLLVQNKPSGNSINLNSYADSYSDIAAVNSNLTAFKNTEIKTKSSFKISGIQTSYNIGDRFKFGRRSDFLTADLLCRSLTYDFTDKTTTVQGDSTLSDYIIRF